MNYLTTATFNSKLAPGVSYKLKRISHGRRVKIQLACAGPLHRIAELQRRLVPVLEEIEKAESISKQEPCTCKHVKEADYRPIADRVEETKVYNARIVASGKGTPVDIVDVCHSSINGRCVVIGCTCRKPQPDPEIGGYDASNDITEQIINIERQEIVPIYIRTLVTEIVGLDIDGQPATVETLLSDGLEDLVTELNEEIQTMIKLSPAESLGFKLPTTTDAAVDGLQGNTEPQTATDAELVGATSSVTVGGSTRN